MKYFFHLILLLIILFSCNSGPDLAAGKTTYTAFCVQCHGEDGKLGLNDSKDLTESTIEFDETVSLISNGKGMMTPYKGILSQEEIETVAHYVMSIRE